MDVSSGGTAGAAAPPRILICGWAGAGNAGDELLARAAIAMVQDAGGIPVVASRDPAATARLHGVEAIALGPRGLTAAARCDGVCVGPGGIIQDATSPWSLPGHLGAALTARLLGKPVIGLGLGAEPLRRRWSRRLLRRALGGCAATVRDRASADALAAAGVRSEIAPDLVFSLGLDPIPSTAELVVAAGPEAGTGRLTTAAWRLSRTDRRRTAGDPFDAGDVAGLAAALDRLSQRHGLRVVFVAFRGERDRRHAERVAAAMSQPSESATGHGVDAVVERVLGAAAVVTSRYHAAVVALAGGVPVAVVSDQAKLAALVDEIDDPQRINRAAGWVSLEATPGRLDPYRPAGHDPSRRALSALVCTASAG